MTFDFVSANETNKLNALWKWHACAIDTNKTEQSLVCTRITVDRAIARVRRPSRAARARPVSWIGGASQGTRHSDTYSAFDASTSQECDVLICSYRYSKALYYYVWDVPRLSRHVCLLSRCYKVGPSNHVKRGVD